MKPLTATLLFLCLSTSVITLRGQGTFQCGSRSQALAEATVTLSDCWSVFGNQAGLAGLTSTVVGGSFQNHFGIKELATHAGLFAIPVQSSVFAVSIIQFGKVPFKQENIGLAYAREIGPKLNFGLQFNYSRIFFPEDNRYSGSIGIDIGFQAFPTKQVILGLHIHDPYTTKIETTTSNFQYPSQIKFGTTLILTNEFYLISELENNFNNHFLVRTGFEYHILGKFILRTGIADMPNRLAFGIGFQANKLSVDLASSYHPDLGNSSSISFQYQF